MSSLSSVFSWSFLIAMSMVLPTRGVQFDWKVAAFHQGLTQRKATHDEAPAFLRTRKPVMFFHIHKSAGTLMCRQAVAKGERIVQPSEWCASDAFRDWWVPGDVNYRAFERVLSGGQGYHDDGWYNTYTCADRVAMFGDNYTWNSVETQLDSHDLCFDDFIYLTIMRDTISRLTSQLNFQTFDKRGVVSCLADAVASPSRDAHCPLNSPGFNLDRDRGFVYFDNYVVRLLGGSHTVGLPPGGVNASHLAAAIAVLDRFDVVIPFEELDTERAHAALDQVLGWHPDDGEEARVGEHAVDFSEDELESLRRINKFEIALYDHVIQKYKSGTGA